MNKLIILDRDGVINKDSDNYIKSVNDWIPIKGSIEAIADLSQAGYQISIATNQSGLARGYFTEDTLNQMHQKMSQLVHNAGGHIDAIYICPHHPLEDCCCRKPKPGLLNRALADFNQKGADTWMIGDSLRDIQAGQKAQCKVALVTTGKGKGTIRQFKKFKLNIHNIPIFKDLNSFSNMILTEGTE